MTGLLSTLAKITQQKSNLLRQEANLWDELASSLKDFEAYKQNIPRVKKYIPDEHEHLLNKEGLLSTKEAANYIGISEKTLPVWRARNEGPEYVKIGRLVRYNKKALDKYIEERTHAIAAERWV